MAAPANSVESEMATEDYCEQCRLFPEFRPLPPGMLPPPSPSLPQNQEHDDDIPLGPSPPQLPFSPLPPQNQDIRRCPLSLSLSQNQEHNDDDIRRLPPLPFSPSLPQNQEHHHDDVQRLLRLYSPSLPQNQEHKDDDIRRLPPLPFLFSPSLPQNQEDDDDLMYPLLWPQKYDDELWLPYSPSLSLPWDSLPLPFLFSPSLPQNQEHDDELVHPNASTLTPNRKRKQKSRKSNGRTSSGVGSDDKFNQGVDESVHGRTIGKLFVSNREIAQGSNGTIVLEGTHEVRQVAVKRLVKACHVVADKEYQNLCVSDRHSNIVRLYGVEEDKDFVYLALERCTGSLNDLIQMQFLDAPTTNRDKATKVNIQYKVHLQSMKGTLPEVKLWEDNGYPSPALWKLMSDMVSGLVHLHELGMVHRDLKPQNVLIVKEGSLCAKLADMGISKRLVGDKSSLGNRATGRGTSGWQAPELLLDGRQTLAIDVFSLGCVLFYCITGGKHPFGDPLVRDVNIVNGKVKLFLVKHIPEAMDLLDHLLDPKAELRPKASEVLIHPMFWDSNKRLSFLRDASDRVQREDSGSAILKELDRIAPRVLGTKPASRRGKNMVLLNWDKKIDPSLLNDIDNPRWYYYHRVCDLVRFIRNKMNHFFDLSHEIQDTLGPVPEGFDGYFRSRFPKLLMEVYKVLHKYCTEEEWFKRYFKGSAV